MLGVIWAKKGIGSCLEQCRFLNVKVPPILTDCGGSFQRDFYLHSTAGFPAPGFPGGSVMKNPPAKARDSGDTGSIPGLEKSSGVGNGNPSSILARKSHEQRSWQATECVVAKSRTRLTD